MGEGREGVGSPERARAKAQPRLPSSVLARRPGLGRHCKGSQQNFVCEGTAAAGWSPSQPVGCPLCRVPKASTHTPTSTPTTLTNVHHHHHHTHSSTPPPSFSQT